MKLKKKNGMNKKKQELFKKIYFDIEKSPVAFTGTRTVYNFLTEKLGIKIIFKDVRDFERKYVPPNQIIRNRN